MRIQFFSDIHLEFGMCEFVQDDVDIIIAAGDIHTYTCAVEWLAQAKCPVIYIAGNHEYYNGDIEMTKDQLKIESKKHEIHFLENETFVLNDTRFLGATLWTDFDSANKLLMDQSVFIMNDYRYILNKNLLITPEDILEFNKKSREWLSNELDKSFAGKTVVITHHAPSLRSWNNNFDNELKFSYCNQLDDLIKQYQIDLWIHGHIHHKSDYMLNGTRIVCNPRGYFGYKMAENFRINESITI